MASRSRSPRRKKTASKRRWSRRPLRERRYLPGGTQRTRAGLVVGGLASLALGAGVYGQWLMDTPQPFARWLFAGGAIGLGLGLLLAESKATPVRVGEAGVAVEGGPELDRLAWWEIESITLERETVRIRGRDTTLTLPRAAHRPAIAQLMKEAGARCPRVLEGSSPTNTGAPAPTNPGELVDANLQLAGLSCAASEQPITLEREAIVCGKCAQIYHREHAPVGCVSCAQALDERAIAPGFDGN